MFKLANLFRRQPPVIVVAPVEEGLHDLASRVHQRLQGVHTDAPMLTMLEIMAEESQHAIELAEFKRITAVRENVYSLPPRQRAAIFDHFEGLTYREIAKKRGITEQAALQDLIGAFSTLRMKDYESNDDNQSGSVPDTVNERTTDARDSALHMAVDCGVHFAGPPGGGVPGGVVEQRFGTDGKESGRD